MNARSLLLAAALALPAGAQDAVEGKMRFDNLERPVTHVYVAEREDVDDRREDKSKPAKSLVIHFASAPLPEEAIGDPAATQEMANQAYARDEWLLSVIAEYYPPDYRNFTLHFPLPSERDSFYTPHQSTEVRGGSAGSKYDFQGLKFAAGRVSGTARTVAPAKVPHLFSDEPPERWELEVKFSAPVRPAPVTTVLTGKPALDSEVFAVALESNRCLLALLNDDNKAGANCPPLSAEEESQLKQLRSGDKEAREMLKFVREVTPQPDWMKQNLARIVLRGDKATLYYGDGSLSQQLVRQDGVWGRPRAR